VLAEVAPLDLVREPLVVDTRRDLGARTLAQLVGRALRPGGWGDVEEDVIVSLLGAAVTGRTAGSAAAHLATAKAYVEGTLADRGLSAGRVAVAVGISERHLSRVLADNGTSFPQYVLSRRLERAHWLLRTERGLSVAEVATRCGFGSAAHFSHAFVRRFGLRASEVRRGGADNPGHRL
jgi:transcriptional regulator GlxA family with amidase domain